MRGILQRLTRLSRGNIRYVAYMKTKNNSSQKTFNTMAKMSHCRMDSFQRFYCQAESPSHGECWYCKAKTPKVKHFLCAECGRLQDITKEHDFFELLSLPRNFNVPPSELTKAFRQLQTLVHPDKFSNKSDREKENSAEWSALINKAYKTLSQPILRGQYLLELQGETLPSDNSALNKEFLMQMMDRNEEVDEADTVDDLNRLNDAIQQEINKDVDQLQGLFQSNEIDNAKAMLVKMKYLLSIQNSIKTKLEKLM